MNTIYELENDDEIGSFILDFGNKETKLGNRNAFRLNLNIT